MNNSTYNIPLQFHEEIEQVDKVCLSLNRCKRLNQRENKKSPSKRIDDNEQTLSAIGSVGMFI